MHLFLCFRLCQLFIFLLSFLCLSLGQNRIHPPPTFGSSSNLEALALQTTKNNIEDGGSAMSVTPYFHR